MTYKIDYQKGENLTPEEEEVADALRHAGYEDPDFDDPDWRMFFTPSASLYDAYLNYTFNLPYREPDSNLTRQQFGIALRRVYGVDYWDSEDRRNFRGRRRINKKRVPGIYGLRGPDTVRLLDQLGRRPKDHDFYAGD